MRRLFFSRLCRTYRSVKQLPCTVATARTFQVGSPHEIGETAAFSQRNAVHYAGAGDSFAVQSVLFKQPVWKGQQRSLFIQMQPTPNPASMMFLPGETLMESGSANFSSAREAKKSPLARKLFSNDGVKQVFFGSDFVTVTKSDDFNWSTLKPDILAAIADHVASGEPLFVDEEAHEASDTAIKEGDSEVVQMIKELLETRIRPSVQEDGGDISYRGFNEDTGVVTLKLQGACSGCPSSSVTLKSGIQNMLSHYVPEVKEVVEAAPDEYEDVAMQEFAKLESRLSP